MKKADSSNWFIVPICMYHNGQRSGSFALARDITAVEILPQSSSLFTADNSLASAGVDVYETVYTGDDEKGQPIMQTIFMGDNSAGK